MQLTFCIGLALRRGLLNPLKDKLLPKNSASITKAEEMVTKWSNWIGERNFAQQCIAMDIFPGVHFSSRKHQCHSLQPSLDVICNVQVLCSASPWDSGGPFASYLAFQECQPPVLLLGRPSEH